MSSPTGSISTDFLQQPLEIVFVAKCEYRKGLHILLSALADIPSHAWHLTVIGAEWQSASFVQDSLAGLETANLTFCGLVENETLPSHLSGKDMIAVPSLYESFGFVSIEGQAAGLPALVSDTGGLASTVEDGVTGWRAAPGHTAQWTAWIERILSRSRQDLQAMGRRARQRVALKYDWRTIVRRYDALFTGAA